MLSIIYKGITPQNRHYKTSVIGNNNADKIKFILSALQNDVDLTNFAPYIKVQSAGGSYLDKIRAVASVEDDSIVIVWTMTRKSLNCRNITIQLQFEDITNSNYVVWQTAMVDVELENTIPADKEIEDKNPSVIQSMEAELRDHEERITTLENKPLVISWGEIVGTIANQTDLVNYIADLLSVKADVEVVNAKFDKSSVKDAYNDDVGNVYDVHYINEQLERLKKQAEFIGEMNSTATTAQELYAELDAYVLEQEGREAREGDLVNVRGGSYDNEQWYRKASSWAKFSDIEFPSGSLDTNNDQSLPVPQTPEDIHSALKLHKVSKTGKASDLVDYLKLLNTEEDQEISGWKKFIKTTLEEIIAKANTNIVFKHSSGVVAFEIGTGTGITTSRYNIVPYSNSTIDLGASNKKWNFLYVNKINFGDTTLDAEKLEEIQTILRL